MVDYADYYGSPELAEWRRLGAIDKSANIIELCRKLDPRRVLEVGCGDGAILRELAARNFAEELLGVDISSSAIEFARTNGTSAQLFDGESLPFDDQSIDLVVLSHVVEHLPYPRQLLFEAKRVARFVFVEVPCEHTARLPRDYAADSVGHINFYTPKTIRRLIQTCGLSVDKQIVRGSSLAVLRYERPVKGTIQYLIREVALKIAPAVAPAVFCYHTALLAQPERH